MINSINRLWLMDSDALRSHLAMVEQYLTSPEALITALGYTSSLSTQDDEDVAPYEIKDGVAMIPLKGTMSKDYDFWMYLYGGASTDRVGYLVNHAVDNPQVSSIMLCISSPGGNVNGTSELGDIVAKANSTKPVWAFCESEVCSAAYWVASQCERIVVGKTTLVGSIGVLTSIVDRSGTLKDTGLKVKKIATGEFKGIGSFFSPVTKEQEAHIQATADSIGNLFIEAINSGRGLNAKLGSGVADGREWVGQAAVDMGLADAVAGKQDTIDRMKHNAGMRRVDGFYASGFGAKGNDFYMQDNKPDGAFMSAVTNALAALGIKIGATNTQDQEHESIPEAQAEAQTQDFSAELEDLKLKFAETDKELATAQAFIGNVCQALGLDPDSGFDALNDGLAKVAAYKEDATVAFDQAVSEMAAETNRAFGAGTTSVETLKASLSGKRLSEIYQATEPLRAAAAARFALSEGDSGGRQTVDEQAPVEDDGIEQARLNARAKLGALYSTGSF